MASWQEVGDYQPDFGEASVPTWQPVDHDPDFSGTHITVTPSDAWQGQGGSAQPNAPQQSPPPLDQSRDQFVDELENPDVRARFYRLIEAEVGGQGPQATQAFVESVMNRAAARGQTLWQAMNDSGYYPRVSLVGRIPTAKDMYQDAIEGGLRGSNVSNYATGNASGAVGFAGGPQTYAPGTGERFGIEGPDRNWVQAMLAGQPLDITPQTTPKQRVPGWSNQDTDKAGAEQDQLLNTYEGPAQVPPTPAETLQFLARGAGNLVAPTATSLATGEPQPMPTGPLPQYGKVPQTSTDPRWGQALIEMAGMMEPPAKLAGVATAAVPMAMRAARAIAPEIDQAIARGALRPVEHVPDFLAPEETGRISTRLPTGKGAESPLVQPRLTVGTSVMSPEQIAVAAERIRTYSALPPDQLRGTPDEIVQNYMNHVKDNLLWLHDHADIAPWRNRAKVWYVGGNRIANELAQRYGIHPNAAAGALAVLSPRTDWFQNVGMTYRLAHVHFNGRNIPFSPEMAEEGRAFYTKPVQQAMLQRIMGKTYGELVSPAERAAWYRLYERRHIPKQYAVITPEGYNAGPQVTGKGRPAGIATQSDENVEKAILALESGGDPDRLTYIIGPMHKVRFFYNNNAAPFSRAGDVTIDTHAVAAGQMVPWGLNDEPVLHNFGPAPSSRETGVMGMYPVYADAYRQAAAERGILPREMQSITWEAIRGLFPDSIKSEQLKNSAQGAWRKYQSGVHSANDARNEIYSLAGGRIRAPDWHAP